MCSLVLVNHLIYLVSGLSSSGSGHRPRLQYSGVINVLRRRSTSKCSFSTSVRKYRLNWPSKSFAERQSPTLMKGRQISGGGKGNVIHENTSELTGRVTNSATRPPLSATGIRVRQHVRKLVTLEASGLIFQKIRTIAGIVSSAALYISRHE